MKFLKPIDLGSETPNNLLDFESDFDVDIELFFQEVVCCDFSLRLLGG